MIGWLSKLNRSVTARPILRRVLFALGMAFPLVMMWMSLSRGMQP